MRIWSLHPSLLDDKGLVAVWREGLLARKVLEGKTKGYKKHPQLKRFREFSKPVAALNSYLYFVFLEAKRREMCFDKGKIYQIEVLEKIIPVTKGQMEFELRHLYSRVKKRAPGYSEMLCKKRLRCNPVFFVVDGGVEKWEKGHPHPDPLPPHPYPLPAGARE
ncbi:MAG: pyrimidine dimer DNA glycosylase/endonuclease V [Candidatus Omnitrophica bacterium]|nr:pyrimidine dimer DNA glycosylase/endonuclease V [Candidatus Omnitrophota bacterium]